MLPAKFRFIWLSGLRGEDFKEIDQPMILFSFSYYKANSFNTQMYDECVEFYTPGGDRRPYSKWNNEAQCTANGGQ
jgi:hypothetical protein